MANSLSNVAMLNVLSDGHFVDILSAIGETVSHAHQSARFTACSASRWPAAGGATERSVGRQPGRHLEIEHTSGLGPQCSALNKHTHMDLDLDNLDLDNSRQEPEAISATSGCAIRKGGEPTIEGRYCVGLSNC